MHVFDGKNWISIFWIPYFPVLPFKTPIPSAAKTVWSSKHNTTQQTLVCCECDGLKSKLNRHPSCRVAFTVTKAPSTPYVTRQAKQIRTCKSYCSDRTVHTAGNEATHDATSNRMGPGSICLRRGLSSVNGAWCENQDSHWRLQF